MYKVFFFFIFFLFFIIEFCMIIKIIEVSDICINVLTEFILIYLCEIYYFNY